MGAETAHRVGPPRDHAPLTCNDTNAAHEIDSNEDGNSANNNGLIRINCGANLASLTNFSIVISSVQSGENVKILTNSSNTVNWPRCSATARAPMMTCRCLYRASSSTSDTTPDDEFKISQLVLTCK